MNRIETDYLVIGAGAMSLAFVDSLLDASDAHITIVDRHGKPGGHWNDAYGFVSLHQPSAFYGVNSTPLGTGRIDDFGINKGLHELASGPEVSGYFDRVMRQRLLGSGRVSYFPMSDYRGDRRFVSLLSGEETEVQVARKIVDATYLSPSVPSTHTPRFAVAEGVRMVPPNDLPLLWRTPDARPEAFVVLGAGKTAMDTLIWLITSGAAPERIYWVAPRDSWLLNRLRVQPGPDFFHESIGGQVAQFKALAECATLPDVFLQLERDGVMLRIDPDVTPTMFHYATMSTGEIEILGKVRNVIRLGRALAINPDGVALEHGRAPMPEGALYIDCTASALTARPPVPIFEPGRITLQMVRMPQPAFSAAVIGHIEGTYADDDRKNQLCIPSPLADTPDLFARCTLANMMNQMSWSREPALNAWIRGCRLDGFGKVAGSVGPDDTDKLAVLQQLRTYAPAAFANIPNLLIEA